MRASTGQLDWERDGQGWPHRHASRFVVAAGLRWHVQQMGPGESTGPLVQVTPPREPNRHAGLNEPTASGSAPGAQVSASKKPQAPWALLIHGTGASTHSWRGLMPLLAAHFNVVAADLPGHGFTGMAPAWQLSLPGMSQALAALLGALGISPQWVVGHSAGAAIAARMSLDGHIHPAALVSLNGALLPLGGLPGLLFPPVAKLMAAVPFVPKLFSRRAANSAAVQRLIEGTGSTLDAAGAELYRRLLRSPGHAAGALGMMANWDLRPLERDLPRLQPQLTLVVGDQDRAVPPDQARRVQVMVAGAQLVELEGLGHLAHEEQPQRVVSAVLRAAGAAGLPAY